MNKGYKDRLIQVYEKHFCGENGRCRLFDECKKNVKYGNEEVCNKYNSSWAQIGDLYGEDKSIPRIVVVGIEGLFGRSEIRSPSLTQDADNPHYRGVKYVTTYLLASFFGKEKPTIVSKYGVNWVDEALRRYTLCNLFRCAFVPKSNPDKFKGLHHSYEMQNNCVRLLIEEIHALDPDIVVVQVASDTYSDSMRAIINDSFCIRWESEDDRAMIGYGKIGNHNVCFINTLHGAHGGFKSHDYLYNELNPILDEAVAWYKTENGNK